MQKSFLLGVLLTSIGLTTIGSDTPIRPLTTLTQPNSGKTLSADDHFPFANGHSPFNDYGPTDSKSPDQQQYPTPNEIMASFSSSRNLLNGDECARLFEETQRDNLCYQPIDFYVKHHEELLANHKAIFAAFTQTIDNENAARLEHERSYDKITKSMGSRLHITDEARDRNHISKLEETSFKHMLESFKKMFEYLSIKQNQHIRTQRKIEVERLSHDLGYKPAPFQRCPVTNRLFDPETLEDVCLSVRWLRPKDSKN